MTKKELRARVEELEGQESQFHAYSELLVAKLRNATLTAELAEARATNAGEMLVVLRTQMDAYQGIWSTMANSITGALAALGAIRWSQTSPSCRTPIL